MLGKWLIPLVSWSQILSILVVVHATKLLLMVVVLAVSVSGSIFSLDQCAGRVKSLFFI
jgi:hypothetical protein